MSPTAEVNFTPSRRLRRWALSPWRRSLRRASWEWTPRSSPGRSDSVWAQTPSCRSAARCSTCWRTSTTRSTPKRCCRHLTASGTYSRTSRMGSRTLQHRSNLSWSSSSAGRHHASSSSQAQRGPASPLYATSSRSSRDLDQSMTPMPPTTSLRHVNALSLVTGPVPTPLPSSRLRI